MTTHGDQIFQHGGVPVSTSNLIPADARLVAPTGDFQPYKHWYPRWKRSRFHTTIASAYAAVGGYKNEVIHLTPGDHVLSETLTWAEYNTHLIGASVNRFQPHVDIWMGTYAVPVAFTPMLEVSGRGNLFANMTFRHGTEAADVVGALISGRYNTFENVYWYTPLVAAQDVATYRGVRITGHNNYFHGCRFGADGTARDGHNYNVTIEGVGNVFEDCIFVATIDGTAPHLLGFCVDYARDCRITLFKRCTFISYSADFGVAMAHAIGMGTSIAGGLYFDPGCQFLGVTEIVSAANSAHVYYSVTGATTTATDSMIALRSQGV